MENLILKSLVLPAPFESGAISRFTPQKRCTCSCNIEHCKSNSWQNLQDTGLIFKCFSPSWTSPRNSHSECPCNCQPVLHQAWLRHQAPLVSQVLGTMRLLHTFCIAILFALSWQGIKAAEQGRACQSCVTGLSDVHSRLAVMSDSDNALEVQQKACQGLPAQQKELCGTFLQLSLPVMAQKLQDSVQVCCSILEE